MTEQMELPLWETLRTAQMVPEQVDFQGLLAEVEEMITQVPESKQLRMAGEAFLRMAEVYAARSDIWIEEWEQAARDPVVERGFFNDLVRQTMAADLSELMEPAPVRKRRTKRAKVTEAEEGSLIVSVNKAALLAMVDKLEEEAAIEEERKQQVLQIAHSENVSQWIEAISQWLRTVPHKQVSFQQLCQSLGMLRVEVWLGLLLGEFELEQGEDFYSDALWVKGASIGSEKRLQCQASNLSGVP